ncbi:MAG TPA: DinB family protein [Nocardioides sp.]|nr:DinB family protein [Nocardioides sp.]
MVDQLQDLSGTTYERTRLRDARFTWINVAGADVRHADLRDVRMRGVELQDVEIDGELQNVVVNGVDIAPLVEAEMARQDPDYARMKPQDADGFREAWQILEGRWAATVERARSLDPDLLHERVDEEWSFTETLRHLCYATDAWVNRVYLGNPDPWSPLDLPFDTLRDLAWPYEKQVRPSLDEVLELRADRQTTVRRVLAALTDERLTETTTPVEGEGWPPPDSYEVSEVLGIVVNEEWHHRRYAERDLAVLESRARAEGDAGKPA